MSRVALALMALALAVSPANAESEVPAAEAIALQATMQTYIDANLVNGALLHIDESSGIVHAYYPAKAHPKIMRVGKYYYLCSNFRDASGSEVIFNFYVAKSGDKYVVFHTLLGDDEALEERIEQHAGDVTN